MAPDNVPVAPCRSAPPSPGDCLVYLPNGTIDWRWDVEQENCTEHIAGSWPAGAANDPRNAPGGNGIGLASQSLVLTDDGNGHYGYWGLASWGFPQKVKCTEYIHSMSAPPSYFNLDEGTSGSGVADATGNSCFHTLWQIDTTATAIAGSCYAWTNAGSSMQWTWNLVKVGNATGK